MDWRDEGILLRVRRHGETSAIIEVLTAAHGRHAGLVRGGGRSKVAAELQPGAQLSLDWNARLSDHLGTFRVDLIRSRSAQIMTDRTRLAALNAIAALAAFLPEREPCSAIYAATEGLVDALAEGNPYWPMLYAHWELALLDGLGFGLDLGSCASTGTSADLVWVSPRTGRAVSRAAGAPYADRMLALPGFLLDGQEAAPGEIDAALALTGHFLAKWVCPQFDMAELPQARQRLVRLTATETALAAP